MIQMKTSLVSQTRQIHPLEPHCLTADPPCPPLAAPWPSTSRPLTLPLDLLDLLDLLEKSFAASKSNSSLHQNSKSQYPCDLQSAGKSYFSIPACEVSMYLFDFYQITSMSRGRMTSNRRGWTCCVNLHSFSGICVKSETLRELDDLR